MPRRLADFPKDLSSYPLDAAELSALGAGRWEYADGEYILREGNADQDLCILEQGSIVVEKGPRTQSERPLILHATLYQKGQFIAFGEMAYFAGGMRTASVRSSGGSVVLRFPPDSIPRIFRQYPEIAERLFRLMAEHLQKTTEEMKTLRSRITPPSIRVDAQAGSVLFERGAKADGLLQCLSGSVELEGPQGKRVASAEDPVGQGLLELGAYLRGAPHAARAVCKTNCLLLKFGPEAKLGVLHAFPEAVLNLLE